MAREAGRVEERRSEYFLPQFRAQLGESREVADERDGFVDEFGVASGNPLGQTGGGQQAQAQAAILRFGQS